MLANLLKIFAKEQEEGEGKDVQHDGGGLGLRTPDSAPANKFSGVTTSPLDIPRQPPANDAGRHAVIDSDDDEEIPTRLVAMSCPLPGNRPQLYVPRRPAVKPALAPKGAKLPNLELPPSLPSDYVIPEPPPPQPQKAQAASLADFEYALQHAASCPPAFRLVVDAQGLPTPLPGYVQLEATPMANSPLIYEVLLSGCLIHPVQKPLAKREDVTLGAAVDLMDQDHEPDHDVDDELEMEL